MGAVGGVNPRRRLSGVRRMPGPSRGSGGPESFRRADRGRRARRPAMFVSHAATLDVSFEVAMTRLAALTGSGVLTQVSADAYAAGAPPSVPWLTGSRFRDLIARPGRAVLAVRGE